MFRRGETRLASAVWIHVNLLDFELELRLAESHRFADYSLTAEAVPERERNGERAAETERRKIKCSCDTCSVVHVSQRRPAQSRLL